MGALQAATAARRLVEMAASDYLAAMVATAATRRYRRRLVATAAMPVLVERAAMAATELAVMAATAAMAALGARVMAATPLVAVAETELCSVLVTTSR